MNTLVFWGGITMSILMAQFGDVIDKIFAVIPLMTAIVALCCDSAAEKVIREIKHLGELNADHKARTSTHEPVTQSRELHHQQATNDKE
jgi:hypothetical protein